MVTTTGIHLASCLGHAQEGALKGTAMAILSTSMRRVVRLKYSTFEFQSLLDRVWVPPSP